MRFLIVAAIMLGSMSGAHALTCDQVRWAVENYGLEAAIKFARSQGYSEKQINQIAKVCLK